MKIYLLSLTILSRFKPIIGKTENSNSTGAITECFQTECDATNFVMNINLVRTCHQFAGYTGPRLEEHLYT